MTRTRVLGLACIGVAVVLQSGVASASAPAVHSARNGVAHITGVASPNHVPRTHANSSNPAPLTPVAAPTTTAAPLTSADPVTLTKHEDLGFNTSLPVSADTGVAHPPCLLTVAVCLFHGAVAFSGTLQVGAKLASDLELSYDPADLNTASGPLPVSVKYTPTPGASTATYSLSGNLTLNFDGCTNCPAVLPVTGTSSPVSFTAPMGADAPVAIPGTSSGITLKVAGIPVITASIGSTLTLGPATPGSLPGLGGAAAVLHATGATGAPLLPI